MNQMTFKISANQGLTPWLLLVVLGTTLVVTGNEKSASAQSVAKTGQQIYSQHCVQCHGDQGQGSELHSDTLHGDLPIADLAQYVAETMPETDPSLVVGDDATTVAKYIYDRFYSPAAQKKLTAARIDLSRLTVRQYQESVADIVGSFLEPHWNASERGLKAHYFAARNWTDERRLSEQVDPAIDFGNGVPHFDPSGKYESLERLNKDKPDNINKMNEGFSVYWGGSLLPPETGHYSIKVESKNGFQLWLNDREQTLIDRKVRSDDELDHGATIFLLGGRAVPLKLQFFSYPDPPAKIRLLWKPPNGSETVIPNCYLVEHEMSPAFAVATTFPADDASTGYERGISVSQQWDEATTAAAVETANWVTEHLWQLAKTEADKPDSIKKVRKFCRRFVERAVGKPLSQEEAHFFVGQHFENDLPLNDSVKRVVIMALKSPRFLFPELESYDQDHAIARRTALVLWDSVPDNQLAEAAGKHKLHDPAMLHDELWRMVDDPRSRAKLRSFFHTWLKTNKAAEATKDQNLFPDFDDELLADLRRSLDLFLEEVVWSEKADFRQLFLADYLWANARIANFYGIKTDFENSNKNFAKISVNPEQRSGILTHPYLMAGLAYHADTSPIHRGVFVARNLLGRRLKQPPDNVQPLTEEFNPAMTTRQRVEHQTKATACMNCHSVINPLGFSLENFDAVGRFRTADKDKTIDVSSAYKTPTGELVELSGARDLAEFLANDTEAQRCFITQLFHYYVKQPVDAFGTDRLNQLHEKFVGSDFNIRMLLIEITKVAVKADQSR